MADLACWNLTRLPTKIIDILEEDIKEFDSSVGTSGLMGNQIDPHIRDSKNSWIPSSHWIGGWLWYYVSKINKENFLYDITDFDSGTIQYTHYGPEKFYNWHSDSDVDAHYKPKQKYSSGENKSMDSITLSGEYVRKLSFSLQLSEPTDYRGGEVQFLDNSGASFFAPKDRGTIIVFDSRIKHRVRKVKSGLRKSLVGWIVGPRWK